MKLLSISYGSHDSNACYYDGEKLRYFKSERYLQEKHHKALSVEELESIVGVSVNDVDQVCFGSFYRNKQVKTRDLNHSVSELATFLRVAA